MTAILILVQKLLEIPLHTFHLSSCNSMYVIMLPPWILRRPVFFIGQTVLAEEIYAILIGKRRRMDIGWETSNDVTEILG